MIFTASGCASSPEPELPVSDGEVADGAALEKGKVYDFPLLEVHCGLEYLGEFNGTAWGLASPPPGPAPETGKGDSIPIQWPSSGESVLGQVSLTASDRIDYVLHDGTLIAIYEPIEPGTYPGCD